jgi:ferritin-like metal-binding protein YciE
MPTTNAQDLFVYELRDIYDAEHKFLEGQQEMVQEATNQKLEKAIQEHIEQTRLHIRNLELVFERLDRQPQRQTSHVAQWLVNEARQSIQGAQNDAVRDCAINAAVIKVEHFEMGSYRTMFTGAQLMGRTEIANLLEQNMRQEEEAARIAERSVAELLQKAQPTKEQGEQEGLIDKAKGKLNELRGQ